MVRTSRATGEHRTGCSKGHPARPQRAKKRRRTLRYVELLSEARTPLADFFSILLTFELSDLAHEEHGLQPQCDSRIRCSAWLGGIFAFLSFPSSPGKVKAHWRAEGTNPCQDRPSPIHEQPNGENGIEDSPNKVDDGPGNLALFIQRCVGWRCHSSVPMRPVMPKYVLSGSV